MENSKQGRTEKELYDMALCQKAAEQGDAAAQYKLGCMYYKGQKLMDYVRAAVWFQRAAEQGHADAQYELGNMYFEGKGVDKDVVKAAEWFEKAAKQDHVNAQFKMAYMCEKGIGVERDDIKAGMYRGILRQKGLLISGEY